MFNELTFDQKYDVISRKDSHYDSFFVTAVLTTGIFCRPSCRARTPKIENIQFFATAGEAIQNGFRPCKICRPMEKSGETPDWIKNIIARLQTKPYEKIKDQDLRDLDIEPAAIRHWFKKNHGITFHAYQRMLRVNSAFREIKENRNISDTTEPETAYQALINFNEGYKTVFGCATGKSKQKQVINIVRFTTRLGAMFACATERGLCLLEFTDRRMLEKQFQSISRLFGAVILPAQNPHLEETRKQVEEYFSGNRKDFTIPLETPGSEFQQQVWQILRQIPYGECRSYKQQAIMLGNPKAVRAVASANGLNRIALIIPCHRVVGSDGSLVGYGGGLARKKWLLDMEQQNRRIEN